ncbi:Hypothetical predicted protein [Podarcis lilfordi]|uniref:Uncharacterized protein n=1 Tax=Podarcis lilfordi TaxID=74358 RepID=A0AA35K9Y3_9SAUR|nr:Hypothetical predicted protein [Podarcis lilfordi]
MTEGLFSAALHTQLLCHSNLWSKGFFSFLKCYKKLQNIFSRMIERATMLLLHHFRPGEGGSCQSANLNDGCAILGLRVPYAKPPPTNPISLICRIFKYIINCGKPFNLINMPQLCLDVHLERLEICPSVLLLSFSQI